MFMIIFPTLTVVLCLISLVRHRKELSPRNVVDILLFYLLLINVGLSGLFAFFGHAFLADQVAASIGWAKGSPFQVEVAMANLAFGVLGVLCIFFKDGFWLATGIGYAVFLFGDAFVHLREMITTGNLSINNVGPILYLGDIAMPALILVLLLMKWRMKRSVSDGSPRSA
jgi:hypothetical protein